jgi:5'(3')-deoxyribonucleotidase
MKFSDFKVKEEAAGVGIITKQNATKDVPVGGEYMNVKKLGLGKGKPKKHPKKVRGSKTNVLFNLGMAESKRLDELLPAVPAAVATAARVATSVLPKIAKNPSHLGATGAGTAVGDKILKQITKSRDANKGVGLKGRNLRAKQLSQKNATNEVTAQDLSKDSEVYVDMDGVLADFFGAWKKLVGTDWREIKDLDSALQKIRDKDDFWLNIPVTSNAMNLLSLIKELKGKYNILSAPLPNDPNAEPHKREWVKKNLSAFPPSKVIITSNKSVHATQPDGTPNILIDDFGKNIAKWEAAGGVGFKHKDHKFERTVKNLKAYMNKPVEEAPEDEIKKIKQTAGAIQKAQSMMKPRYSSEIAALVEEEFEAIREAALRRYKKAKGKIDLYTAYTMAIEDEFPEIPNPIVVFQYMTDPVDPNHQDLVPQEAEDGSWADRADKDYQQKAKSKPKGTGFNPLIKGRWFAIKADRDRYLDQGMEPEDALDQAAERHGVDPEELEKWIAAGNAVKIKEAKMSKSSIKSIHKTADKIKDKPKAKKSIGNWAKERGMDPEGAIYAIATNMKKRKQGKKITGLGKESYTREELPQIRKQHLDYIPHTMETVQVKDVVPVQKERLKENHKKQLYNILDGRFNPIVVDCYNRIVNGHHRYDILKMLNMESTTVAKLPFTLEFLLEITRRDFLKGLGATAAMSMVPKAAKALANNKEQWYVIDEKGRLQGPMDSSKAKTVSIAYPKKLPAIEPAPEGFEIIIAQGSSKNLNMAFTKAEFAIKKIYARRFPGKTVNVNRKIIKLQGRAIEAAGSSYVATQSAYVKKTTEESVEEGNLIANPQRSVLVKKKNGYDWYKIGTNMANITQRGIDSAVKKDKPDIMLQFYGGEKEKKYMMRNLKRMGYDVQDADGYNDTHFDENIEGSYRLMISLENFADGKKKGRKGLSKRVGIPKGASVTQLRKIAKNSTGERRRMAHWQANMKSGRKKKGK